MNNSVRPLAPDAGTAPQAPRDDGYWPARLAGAPAAGFPADLAPRPGAGHAPEAISRPLPVRPGMAAGDPAGAVGPGLAPAVLTAVITVLHRHTGTGESIIGFGHAAATGEAAGEGEKAWLLPVRVPLDQDLTFPDAARAVAAALAGDLAHAAQWPRSAAASRAAAAQVAFSPDGAAGAARLDHAAAHLVFAADPGTATLSLRYDSALITPATAAMLLDDCHTLLLRGAEQPDTPLCELPMRAREDGEEAAGPPPPDLAGGLGRAQGSLVDRFREVAARHGEQIAVHGASGMCTYAELDAVSERAARRLRGIAGGAARVAVLCGHDTGSAYGIWSVLKAGAACVPLDPLQPAARLRRIVADADVAAILCDPGLADLATAIGRGRPAIVLDPADPAAPAGSGGACGQPEAGARTAADPQAPAYLLYTSGSTGIPKGVLQSHRNVLAHAAAYARAARIGPDDHVALLARTTSDAAVMDFYGALLTGASLYIVDPLQSAPRLRAALAVSRTRVLHCTPTLLRHLVGDLSPGLPGKSSARVPELATIRTVVLGGEEATPQDLRTVLDAFGEECVLINGLGPTECTVALQHTATAADLELRALPVGRPVPGLAVRLLDEAGRPAEVFGELEIVGSRVALGYWNRPEATAAVFGADADGTRRYRTGDLVRRRADGSLVFAGRRDRQVKIRGHRVEPTEIEAALRAHPLVAQAAVIPDPRDAVTSLAGYVTPATSLAPNRPELADYLARILPDYALPRRIAVLDSMPLGPTGKIDRAALPPIADDEPSAGRPPSGALETGLARLWCGVLGTTEADADVNFMAAGGDSMLMLRLLAAVREEYAVEVPLFTFLRNPTIAQLARTVERERPGPADAPGTGGGEPLHRTTGRPIL